MKYMMSTGEAICGACGEKYNWKEMGITALKAMQKHRRECKEH